MLWMIFLPAFAGVLSACGEDEPDEPDDREPPRVELVFPTRNSAVESRTVIMRGTAAPSCAFGRRKGMTPAEESRARNWDV